MYFSDIEKILINKKVIGKLSKKKIKYITDHSNNTNKNTLLIIDKNKRFKKEYLQNAISQGLNTILTNKPYKNLLITQIIVKDINENVSKLLKFRNLCNPKKSIAITGTNGKTSSSWYLAQICKYDNKKTRLTGTLGFFENLKKVKDSNLTNPNYLDLYQFAYSNKRNKFYFIAEASSHGLDQGRFNNFNIDVAAITNLTQDHLDYHKSFNAYMKSKFSLFTKYLNYNGIAVINSRLKNYDKLILELKKRKLKKIIFGKKDVFIKANKSLSIYIFGKKYKLKELNLNNVQKENLECAVACALAINISPNQIIKSLKYIKRIPGRFDEINYKKKFAKIVIDYAHTPDALKSVLKSYNSNNKKPLLVFGCGGERDKSKRKKMAIIASKFAQKVFLTDDNPRNENPKLIRKTIKRYCPKAIEIADRRSAIEVAISQMQNNDILIVAGKGHEKFQLIKNKKIKFDDYEIAKNYIK